MLKQEDIARLAGVSRATVSRVLNNEKSVKKITREKILEIIEKHGYEKNYISSTLATKNEKIVYAFLLKSVINYYSDELKKGLKEIEEEYKGFGYKIKVIETSINEPENQLKELDQVLERKDVAGIIITPLIKTEILKRVQSNEKVKFLSLDNFLCETVAHVGANYHNSGQVAGDIFRGILREDEKVLVLKFPGDKVSVEEYYKGLAISIPRNQLRVVEVRKNILQLDNFLEEYLDDSIKGIFSNRYTLELIDKNLEILTKEKKYKIVGIAGNPKINNYVKEEIMYASINEQFSTISYIAGKTMFESLYKNRKSIEHTFINPVVAFKSLIK
ncbi:LacI family DNA-binding transcriptional regulator [Cetobacterium somerae]|uniref:LacI family DNA-binding transcriptional regulator n=1 Tax=Cetobacterium sp. NK01 TaxID=2993530 RepID=UPI0021163911|nr:LacI family DNA-binding transcriptional regulator [Cetobacterium sp. NK01]MCQ8212135.1 LacI family DNA-binding transcriptional regulator [Cetobacterium sp. NK01]